MRFKHLHQGRVALWLAGVLVLASCATNAQDDAPTVCGQGKLIEDDSSAFCVYHLDEPLVIEGGFECPASFEFRLEMASSIACGNRTLRLENLPHAVCTEIGEQCELAQLRSHDTVERMGGPGECIRPCETVADCALGDSGTHGQDNYACVDGACKYTGCNDDDECAIDIPQPVTVCRPDLYEAVPNCKDACEERADCFSEGDRPEEQWRVDCVDGACVPVGCTMDSQCHSPGACLDTGHGYRDCAFRCVTPEDCAAAAQEELGLDGVDPNDPFTEASAFVCRQGACRGKPMGCASDDDCGVGSRCKLPRD